MASKEGEQREGGGGGGKREEIEGGGGEVTDQDLKFIAVHSNLNIRSSLYTAQSTVGQSWSKSIQIIF